MTSTGNTDLLQQEGWKTGAGGDRFYTREFGPNERPKAVVLFLHGLMEHSGRYINVFPTWAARGIHALALDQRGYGKTCSDPEMKAIDAAFGRTSGIHQVKDTEYFLKELAQRFPGVPIFLMGFSMGGGRALWFVTRDSEPPLRESVGLITGVMVIQTGTKPEMLSRNPTTNQAWLEDPLIKPQGTARNLVDLLDDGEELERAGYKNWPKDLPLLILHGDSDPVTCPVGSKRFFDALDATDKTYKSFPGGYHELHNEPDKIKEEWHETCLNWIDRVVSEKRRGH